MEQGLSGDKVEIIGNIVRKTCLTNEEKFRKQIDKQKKWKDDIIQSVPVIKEGRDDLGSYYAEMPNITQNLYSSNDCYKPCIKSKLAQYINNNISNSKLEEFPYKQWYDKINLLSFDINDKYVNTILDELYKIRFKSLIPIGKSHGDFTTSNILIQDDNNIYAVDFSIPFIETPINDMVKINQYENILPSYEENEYYIPFAIMSYIRMLPYSKEENLTSWIKGKIGVNYEKLLSYSSMCGQK